MEQGRDVPGRSDGVSVGPGQLGFTSVGAAKTAEGLRKPEGGPPVRKWHSSPPAAGASPVTAERGTRSSCVVGTLKPREVYPSRRRELAGNTRRTAGREAHPGSTLKGSRTSREDPSPAHAWEGGLDTEDPEARVRKDKGMGGEPGAKAGSTWRAP